MRGNFTNVANLVKGSREKTPWSQTEVSHQLGYKNGQFISNIERGLCSVPVKKVFALCCLIGCDVSAMKEAMIRDFCQSFDSEIQRNINSPGEANGND